MNGDFLQTRIDLPQATGSSTLTLYRSYDRAGHLITTIQPGAQADYAYDPMGDVVAIKDPVNSTIRATYDNFRRKVAVNDPDKGNWLYTWDGFGRLAAQQDGNGLTTQYVYDAGARKKERWIGNASTPDRWAYDPSLGVLNTEVGSDGFNRSVVYDNFPARSTTGKEANAGGSAS